MGAEGLGGPQSPAVVEEVRRMLVGAVLKGVEGHWDSEDGVTTVTFTFDEEREVTIEPRGFGLHITGGQSTEDSPYR